MLTFSLENTEIREVIVKDTRTDIVFKDPLHERLVIEDSASYCCEHRYMATDDDLDYYKGARFLGVKVADGPRASDEDGCMDKDVKFLNIFTTRGVFTVQSYNEHNGYYGGFELRYSVYGTVEE